MRNDNTFSTSPEALKQHDAYLHIELHAHGNTTKLQAFKDLLQAAINRYTGSLDITFNDVKPKKGK